MWTDCYYKKRTLTKFLGVDKHMIPGDPIRGNDDICNNNYLVLYDVVSDVESDVLDKTDRTGYSMLPSIQTLQFKIAITFLC